MFHDAAERIRPGEEVDVARGGEDARKPLGGPPAGRGGEMVRDVYVSGGSRHAARAQPPGMLCAAGRPVYGPGLQTPDFPR